MPNYNTTVYIKDFANDIAERDIRDTLERRFGLIVSFEVKSSHGNRYVAVKYHDVMHANSAYFNINSVFPNAKAYWVESAITHPIQIYATLINDVQNHLPNSFDIIELNDPHMEKEILSLKSSKAPSRVVLAPPTPINLPNLFISPLINIVQPDNCSMAMLGDKVIPTLLNDYITENHPSIEFKLRTKLINCLVMNNTLGYISRLTGLSARAGLTGPRITKKDGDLLEAYFAGLIFKLVQDNSNECKIIKNEIIKRLFGGIIIKAINDEQYKNLSENNVMKDRFYDICKEFFNP